MDLKDEQWAIVEPLLPKPPRRADGKGRPRGIEPHRVTDFLPPIALELPHPNTKSGAALEGCPYLKSATKNGSDQAPSGPLFVATALLALLAAHPLTLL